MRFAYLYFMAGEPEQIRAVAPRHAAYWREQGLAQYLGGPFADRSGGLIIFETSSPAEAQQIVSNDPFMREGLLSRHWTKEWVIE